MNAVAMTIINPRKEYWPSRGSNQRPHVIKSDLKQFFSFKIPRAYQRNEKYDHKEAHPSHGKGKKNRYLLQYNFDDFGIEYHYFKVSIAAN